MNGNSSAFSKMSETQPVQERRSSTDSDDIGIVDEGLEVLEVSPTQGLSESPCPAKPRFLKPGVLKIGDKVFGLDRGLKDPWREATIENFSTAFGKNLVGLKFNPANAVGRRRKFIEFRQVNLKHVAYFDPPMDVMPVGFRVIASTQDITVTGKCLFAGTVGEIPKSVNKNRYLIFFDDGLAAYCLPEHVRMTLSVSTTPPGKLWSDAHPDMQRFIRHYILQYPQVKFARLRLSEITTVEWNGIWWSARVKEIDCSLVKLQLTCNNLILSVWKGSARIISMYRETKLFRQIPITVVTNEEYEGRVVKHQIPERHLDKRIDNSTFFSDNHQCSKGCWGYFRGKPIELRTVSPLAVPFYYSWKRAFEPDDRQRRVYYQAPCGMKFYTMEALQAFLTTLRCPLGIDHFSFDFSIQCLDEFQPSKKPSFTIEDISSGSEVVPISKINAVDNIEPPYVVYTHQRVYGQDVRVNMDKDFQICCDCEDDCSDKLNCDCFRLTFEREDEFFKNPNGFTKGYQNRRLMDKFPLGIYECNDRCKCRKTCINRVVQHGLKWKLQVFKTANKGFGIRTLQDIPEGSFICIYTGELLSSKQANEFGSAFGDEYLANIDFIEFAETFKEGYEENVVEPEPEPMPPPPLPVRRGRPRKSKARVGKKSRGKKANEAGRKETSKETSLPQQTKCGNKRKRDTEDSPEKAAAAGTEDHQNHLGGSQCSKTRSFFGTDDEKEIFTIDARRIGNIGRYLNHSCDPNVFAQDVFIDTNDIRFPWVAFFASRYLKAGTELTWDYNYEIGMASGKQLVCNCGSLYCRKRLL